MKQGTRRRVRCTSSILTTRTNPSSTLSESFVLNKSSVERSDFPSFSECEGILPLESIFLTELKAKVRPRDFTSFESLETMSPRSVGAARFFLMGRLKEKTKRGTT